MRLEIVEGSWWDQPACSCCDEAFEVVFYNTSIDGVAVGGSCYSKQEALEQFLEHLGYEIVYTDEEMD